MSYSVLRSKPRRPRATAPIESNLLIARHAQIDPSQLSNNGPHGLHSLLAPYQDDPHRRQGAHVYLDDTSHSPLTALPTHPLHCLRYLLISYGRTGCCRTHSCSRTCAVPVLQRGCRRPRFSFPASSQTGGPRSERGVYVILSSSQSLTRTLSLRDELEESLPYSHLCASWFSWTSQASLPIQNQKQGL